MGILDILYNELRRLKDKKISKKEKKKVAYEVIERCLKLFVSKYEQMKARAYLIDEARKTCFEDADNLLTVATETENMVDENTTQQLKAISQQLRYVRKIKSHPDLPAQWQEFENNIKGIVDSVNNLINTLGERGNIEIEEL